MKYSTDTSRMESLFYTFSKLTSREGAEILAVEAYLNFLLYQIEDMTALRNDTITFRNQYILNNRSTWASAIGSAYEVRIGVYNDHITILKDKYKVLKDEHDKQEILRKNVMLAHMYPTHNTVINLHK